MESDYKRSHMSHWGVSLLYCKQREVCRAFIVTHHLVLSRSSVQTFEKPRFGAGFCGRYMVKKALIFREETGAQQEEV